MVIDAHLTDVHHLARGGGEALGVASVAGAQHDPVAGELGLQAVGRIVRDDAPMVHDHHALGHRVGLVEVVRRQEHGHPVLGAQAQNVLPEGCPDLRVEARRRLVEEQHRRALHEPDRHVEPAALTARQRARLAVGERLEVERGEQLLRASARLARADAEAAALRDELVADALGRPRGVALAHVADAPSHRVGLTHDVVTGDPRLADRRPQERRQHAQARRLARTVGAEEGDELTLGDVEVEPADRLDHSRARLEVAGEAAGADDRAGRRRGRASALRPPAGQRRRLKKG
nr:hypothetical protein [Capillimicrobium parvum]